MSEKERTIHITSLDQLTDLQVRAVLSKAEIKATGTFIPPPFDLAAIKARAAEMEQGQAKTDMYMLIMEVEKLSIAIAGKEQCQPQYR